MQPCALEPAYGASLGRAQLRSVADDFQVIEQVGFQPDGQGEQAWLWVRKRGANTEWVARELARYAGVKPEAVSFAGLKDRHALTEQAFTVHLPGQAGPDWLALQHPEFTILHATRHSRKLKRGTLKGNQFCIVLRQVEADPAALEQRWQQVLRYGVPNYFAQQRFGHNNLERALALFNGAKVRDRQQRSLYLSSARSELFNRVLAARVADGSWCQLLAGELAMLDGRRSVFLVEQPDAELQARLAAFDIHPSGPLWGAGVLGTTGVVAELEQRIAEQAGLLATGLVAQGLEQERRALRLVPREAQLQWLDATSVQLRFFLPAGAYATTVIGQLLETWEA